MYMSACNHIISQLFEIQRQKKEKKKIRETNTQKREYIYIISAIYSRAV